MEDSLLITTREKDSMVILDLQGKIIGSWALHMKDKLEELHAAGEYSIVLNFQEVISIDSLGVMAISTGIESGSRIRILHPNTNCIEVLQQHRLTDRVELFFREDEALRSFRHVGASARTERRRHKRIETNIPIEIEYRDNRLRGVLLNISEGGALLGYLDPLEPGAVSAAPAESPRLAESLRVSLKLPFLGIIELAGRPVSFRQNSEMHTLGIQILHNERSRHLLQKMVDDPTTTFPHQE